MMRKDNGAPGIPVIRLCRIPLTALLVILTFLLGSAATAPAAAAPAVPAGAALKPSGAAQAPDESSDSSEDSVDREAERGQPRRVARNSVGIPQHTGRLLPPCRTDPTSVPAPAAGRPPVDGWDTSALRPLELPVLHCVFRC
ncbi:hypothetical protein QOM21_32280 [Streptomyces sp. Pv4-95]|uniref:hypothetical protein n=1 Tax=Streptomyces sp. Pv4-95 TaxID=3049543 RepID=UPI003892A0CE